MSGWMDGWTRESLAAPEFLGLLEDNSSNCRESFKRKKKVDLEVPEPQGKVTREHSPCHLASTHFPELWNNYIVLTPGDAPANTCKEMQRGQLMSRTTKPKGTLRAGESSSILQG
jgi:hypothetical protein